MPQVTSRPRCSHIRLGSWTLQIHGLIASLPPAPKARSVSDSEIKACSTLKLEPLDISPQANYHMEIRFRWRHGDRSFLARGMNRQIAICDNVSFRNVIRVPILLRVSFHLISVTKLWDMIIRLCMCQGRIGHANVQESKSHWLTTDEHDIVLPVTAKSGNSN